MDTPFTDVVSLLVAVVALIVSIIALVYTVQAFALKSGLDIRGSFNSCSSVYGDDKYVCRVTLENLKDKATVIFKIYLKMGHNYYVLIDNFEDEPLILKPFEAFRRSYDPVDFYSVNTYRIKIDGLLEDDKVPKKLILSTSDGKYVVETGFVQWDPVFLSFKNHFTAVIHPMRLIFKGKSFGSNTKFVAVVKHEDGEDIIPFYPDSHKFNMFRRFRLTEDALGSKESLENFLREKQGEGVFKATSIEVYDYKERSKEAFTFGYKESATATYQNWFMYYVVGKIRTIVSDIQLKRRNRDSRKAHRRQKAGDK